MSENHLGYEVISINVGEPIEIPNHDQMVSTAIFKQPAKLPIRLSRVNFAGDRQGDLVHHGGPDKAVNVYAFDHFPYWEEWLGKKLSYGAFGENLTVSGLVENAVNIGDIYRLGEARLQVSQPRYPCYKLALKHDAPAIVKQVIDTGYTGFYFRVLQEGVVSAGDRLILVEAHPKAISIPHVNAQLKRKNEDEIREILEVKELADSWRTILEKQLNS